VAAVEVEWLVLGPETLDDRAGFSKGTDRLARGDHVNAVGVVLTVDHLETHRVADSAPAGSDAELQPPAGR